eukprot:3810450-Rhodomonas_salina.3
MASDGENGGINLNAIMIRDVIVTVSVTVSTPGYCQCVSLSDVRPLSDLSPIVSFVPQHYYY